MSVHARLLRVENAASPRKAAPRICLRALPTALCMISCGGNGRGVNRYGVALDILFLTPWNQLKEQCPHL